MFNDRISDCILIQSGIGQGTIVGPIIFLLYINDIVQMLPNVHINMYADDCMLYTSGNNWNNVYDCLQQSLSNFDMWCMQNDMVLNVSKSKCLCIGSRHKLRGIDYERRLSVCNIYLDYVKKLLLPGNIFR